MVTTFPLLGKSRGDDRRRWGGFLATATLRLRWGWRGTRKNERFRINSSGNSANFIRKQSSSLVTSRSLFVFHQHLCTYKTKGRKLTQACVQLRTYSTGVASPSKQAGSSISSPYWNCTIPPTEFLTLKS